MYVIVQRWPFIDRRRVLLYRTDATRTSLASTSSVFTMYTPPRRSTLVAMALLLVVVARFPPHAVCASIEVGRPYCIGRVIHMMELDEAASVRLWNFLCSLSLRRDHR